MSKGNHKLPFHILALNPTPEDVDPNYINITLPQTEINPTVMSVPSSQSVTYHLVLIQSASAYLISDPGVSSPYTTNT